MDEQTTALVVSLAVSLALAAHRVVMAFLRWLELRIAAASERSRRRELKRQRRESSGPLRLPRTNPHGIPQEFADEENTDMHELVELERRQAKTRRSPGERPPRRGTHHDSD